MKSVELSGLAALNMLYTATADEDERRRLHRALVDSRGLVFVGASMINPSHNGTHRFQGPEDDVDFWLDALATFVSQDDRVLRQDGNGTIAVVNKRDLANETVYSNPMAPAVEHKNKKEGVR